MRVVLARLRERLIAVGGVVIAAQAELPGITASQAQCADKVVPVGIRVATHLKEVAGGVGCAHPKPGQGISQVIFDAAIEQSVGFGNSQRDIGCARIGGKPVPGAHVAVNNQTRVL